MCFVCSQARWPLCSHPSPSLCRWRLSMSDIMADCTDTADCSCHGSAVPGPDKSCSAGPPTVPTDEAGVWVVWEIGVAVGCRV